MLDLRRHWCAFAICASIGACAAQPQPAAPAPPAASPSAIAAAASRVDALIGAARCDSDAQCRTVARGAKACGGPTRYSAWSVRDTDAKALDEAVARESALVQAELERSGRVSNCMMLADPGARCVDRRCVAGSGPAAPVPR